MYQIHIERRAVKECEKISDIHRRNILEKISTILSVHPYPRGDNPKRLIGERAFRLRVGDYRILYTIQRESVFIYAIRHRKDVYH